MENLFNKTIHVMKDDVIYKLDKYNPVDSNDGVIRIDLKPEYMKINNQWYIANDQIEWEGVSWYYITMALEHELEYEYNYIILKDKTIEEIITNARCLYCGSENSFCECQSIMTKLSNIFNFDNIDKYGVFGINLNDKYKLFVERSSYQDINNDTVIQYCIEVLDNEDEILETFGYTTSLEDEESTFDDTKQEILAFIIDKEE